MRATISVSRHTNRRILWLVVSSFGCWAKHNETYQHRLSM